MRLIFSNAILFYYWFLKRERKEERETDLLFHLLCIHGWFLCVPWLGVKPTILVYWEDALTNWAPYKGKGDF